MLWGSGKGVKEAGMKGVRSGIAPLSRRVGVCRFIYLGSDLCGPGVEEVLEF